MLTPPSPALPFQILPLGRAGLAGAASGSNVAAFGSGSAPRLWCVLTNTHVGPFAWKANGPRVPLKGRAPNGERARLDQEAGANS